MKIIKICTKSLINDSIINQFAKVYQVEVHKYTIDNSSQFLRGQKNMRWLSIYDIFIVKSKLFCVPEMLEHISQLFNYEDVEIFLLSTLAYGTPMNGADIITSCYSWSTYPLKEREAALQQHFLMEQSQQYYDYILFQLVEKYISNYKNYKNDIDFFFVSHVSNPDGINQIYSKPFIMDMREHSKLFLNVDSRCLSFGTVAFL